MFDDNSSNESERTRMYFQRIFKVSISMNISDMTIINQNIQDTKMIETNHQDIHHTLNDFATIRSMMTIESINFENFFRIIRTIRMTQTRLILILILFIQNSHQVRMMLTELRDLFLIQIKLQTTANMNHDLIHSKILHRRMIHHQLQIKFDRTERRDLLNFRFDRMNSIEETTNTKARFIT